jgi:hypothetical protein
MAVRLCYFVKRRYELWQDQFVEVDLYAALRGVKGVVHQKTRFRVLLIVL